MQRQRGSKEVQWKFRSDGPYLIGSNRPLKKFNRIMLVSSQALRLKEKNNLKSRGLRNAECRGLFERNSQLGTPTPSSFASGGSFFC